jgi:hypothetical protein
MKVALVCIAKDEDNYIQEWIKYHKEIGFDDIFIYENNWRSGINQTNVKTIPFDGSCMQLRAYNDFIQKKKGQYDWAAFIDVDEFISLKKHSDIKKFILEHGKIGHGIAINWVIFGNNNHDQVKDNNYSVIDRFTKCLKDPSGHIKSLLKLSTNKIRMNNCHHPNNIIVDTNKVLVSGPFNVNGPTDVIQLNHYLYKTREEYINKCKWGRADAISQVDSNSWKGNLYNISTDLTAYYVLHKHKVKNKQFSIYACSDGLLHDFTNLISNNYINNGSIIELPRNITELESITRVKVVPDFSWIIHNEYTESWKLTSAANTRISIETDHEKVDRARDFQIVYFINTNLSEKYGVLLKAQFENLFKDFCNIKTKSSKIKIDVVYTANQNLDAVIRDYLANCFFYNPDKFKIELIHSELDNYEYPGVHHIWKLAQKTDCYDTLFLYFHGKGITYTDFMKNQRSSLEEKVFKNVISPVEKIISLFNRVSSIKKFGSSVAEPGFIWFNYWWSTSSYLKTLEEPIFSNNRFYYEDWLCRSLKSDSAEYNFSLDSCVGLRIVDGQQVYDLNNPCGPDSAHRGLI